MAMHQHLGSLVGQLPTAPEGARNKMIMLVALLVDNSSSIRSCGNVDAVLGGVNSFLVELRSAPGDVRMILTFFHEQEYMEFTEPQHVQTLTPRDFPIERGTPLHFRTDQVLSRLMQEEQRLTEQGFYVVTVFFLFTDGWDTSGGMEPETVKRKVRDMLATERSIVHACAVRDGRTDFRSVLAEMGILHVDELEGGRQITEAFTRFGQDTAFATSDPESFTRLRDRDQHDPS